jgi:3-hydroxymyristoyl/3-hydroxydecanoyl-(acyl carrier protein) dehydratase
VRGHRLLAAISGAPGLDESCRELLLAQFEPSTLPRRFLFLDKLPREANGKLMRHRLLRLFGLDDDGASLSRALDFTVTTNEHLVLASTRVPQDYIAYSGHFDQYAVLAGAVQLQHVVMPVLRSVKPNWLHPKELRRIKFMGRIEPGDDLEIELTLRETECEFTLKKRDKVCSAGVLVFDVPKESSATVPSTRDTHV